MPEQEPQVRNKNFKEVTTVIRRKWPWKRLKGAWTAKENVHERCPVNVQIRIYSLIAEGKLRSLLKIGNQQPARHLWQGLPAGIPVRTAVRARKKG